MTRQRPTALIADDEPLLRKSLARLLAQAWPELEIVAQARIAGRDPGIGVRRCRDEACQDRQGQRPRSDLRQRKQT